jgi:hypothetical protein
VAYDTGYGYGYPDYEAPYYSGGYGGPYGYYGTPYYGPGVVIGGVGRGFHDHDHERHEAIEHQRHEAFEHGRPAVAAPNVAARPLPPVAHPAAPMNRAPTVARPAPPMTRPAAPNRAMMAPPPGRHHF